MKIVQLHHDAVNSEMYNHLLTLAPCLLSLMPGNLLTSYRGPVHNGMWDLTDLNLEVLEKKPDYLVIALYQCVNDPINDLAVEMRVFIYTQSAEPLRKTDLFGDHLMYSHLNKVDLQQKSFLNRHLSDLLKEFLRQSHLFV